MDLALEPSTETPITETQQDILRFIAECLEERSVPPTLREISARCGVSSIGSVSYHLKVLERRGLLARMSGRSRGLEPLESPFRLPILGRVGAGGGPLAVEDIEGRLSVGKDAARGAQFLLRVRGDSMTGAGILEGDLVAVRRQDSAEDGDLVVALVGEEGVVKRLKRRNRAWRLESANPKYAPITGEFRVLGAVTTLIRRY